MIVQKTVTINGKDFTKTYSDQRKMIERNGIKYTIALDPVNTDRVYTETDIIIPMTNLNKAREEKRNSLKKIRDEKEMEPVEYNGYYFDFDEKSYNRITAAIFTLSKTEGSTIMWTTADNQSVSMTADDLEGVISSAAVRSNMLHVKYRQLSDLIEEADEFDLNHITWDSI